MHPYEVAGTERVFHVYRQSKVILIKPILVSLFLITVPWYFFITRAITEFRVYLLIWTLIIIAYAVRESVLWRINRYVVTSKRLIRIEHMELFHKVVIETPLDRILNISFKTTGLVSVLFRFGDVEVQVVGLIEPIILRNIHSPAKIKDYLWKVHQKFLESAGKNSDISHLEERIGYTKPNQKVI